jgi:hypothetical protein
VPRSLPPGQYDRLLHLPDPSPRLYGRPEYSIRLANRGVWEPATGFNRLLTSVRLLAGTPEGDAPRHWFTAHPAGVRAEPGSDAGLRH